MEHDGNDDRDDAALGPDSETEGKVRADADEPWVEVASFRDLPLAHVAASALEARGLEANVLDGFTIGADWLYSAAIGGVRVRVPASQVEVAREIISDLKIDAPGDGTIAEDELPNELRGYQGDDIEEAASLRQGRRSKVAPAVIGLLFLSPIVPLLIWIGSCWEGR